MVEAVNIYEAKTQLSALVEKAARGEEIVIAKAGKPMARLVPLAGTVAEQPRVFGQNVMGITHIAPDFDEPLPADILDAFYEGPVFPGKSEDGEGAAPASTRTR